MIKPRIQQVTSKNTREEKVNKYEEVAKSSEDYSDENDDGIFPLLLNLQGYIESPARQILPESSNPPKSLTILPVYTIDNSGAEDNENKNDATAEENEARNFFRDENYAGRSDFPNRLENAFQGEAASIMRNQTGDGDVKVNDIKWEYEYDEEEEEVEDDPKSWDDAQVTFSFE